MSAKLMREVLQRQGFSLKDCFALTQAIFASIEGELVRVGVIEVVPNMRKRLSSQIGGNSVPVPLVRFRVSRVLKQILAKVYGHATSTQKDAAVFDSKSA